MLGEFALETSAVDAKHAGGLGDVAITVGEDALDVSRTQETTRYHVIGKEILWFHAVIWPALLMALDRRRNY